MAPPEEPSGAAPFLNVPFFTASAHRSVELLACMPRIQRFSPLPSMAQPFRSMVSAVGVSFLLFMEIWTVPSQSASSLMVSSVLAAATAAPSVLKYWGASPALAISATVPSGTVSPTAGVSPSPSCTAGTAVTVSGSSAAFSPSWGSSGASSSAPPCSSAAG